jgi:hypothetical protein
VQALTVDRSASLADIEVDAAAASLIIVVATLPPTRLPADA